MGTRSKPKVNALKGYQHGVKCDKHPNALARHEWGGKHYCKGCWKRLRKFLGYSGKAKKKRRLKNPCFSHSDRNGKFYWLGRYYCKKCYKELWISADQEKRKHLQHHRKKIRPKAGPPKSLKAKRKTVTARVLRLRRDATPAELAFKAKLKIACPVKFKFQRGFIKGGYYAIVDFFIPSRKLCIEIDGGYHDTPEQQAKDAHRDKWLREVRRLKVERLTNEQAFNITIDEVKELIRV